MHTYTQDANSEQLAAYADIASALMRLRLCAGTLYAAWMTLGKPSLAQVCVCVCVCACVRTSSSRRNRCVCCMFHTVLACPHRPSLELLLVEERKEELRRQ